MAPSLTGTRWHVCGTTLVIYMGMARLPALVAGMRAGGFAADTPACAIQNGTLATERSVIATLATLARAVAEAKLASPAIIVVGEVVRFARRAAESDALRAA